jgi:hypothetical protein
MPAHPPDLADQLFAIHDVFHDPLRLLGTLLVPGVDEDEAPVAGDDQAAAEELAGLVVELQIVQPLGQRIALLLLVEGDLDAPLVAAPGRVIPVVHGPNSSFPRPRPRGHPGRG